MSSEQLESQVIASILKKLGIENRNNELISYDIPLFAANDAKGVGLQLDSIDALEIVIAIKQDFGVKIGDEDIEVLKNVSSIANFIRKNKIT